MGVYDDNYYDDHASHPARVTMVCGGAGALLLAYGVGLAVYRLCLSPIAGFPGPKLAALSLWYEFYYDVVCGGRYWAKIDELHDRYGPIIRINPHELHVRDPDFHDLLYAGPTSGQRRDKWAWSVNMFANSQSGFGTVPHDLHRARRAALNPFFSKQAIAARVQPQIRDLLTKMCARFEAMRGTGEVLNVMEAYAALTTDVITRYAFDASYGCVGDPDWRAEWPRAMVEGTKTCHLNKQFPWVVPLMRAVPEGVVGRLNPAVLHLINFQKDLARQITAIMNETADSKADPTRDPPERPPTIFHELLRSSSLPPEEKSLQRLVDEGQTLIAAGQETTSFHLQTVTYHVLANPSIHARLRAELRDEVADPLTASVAQLERLSYLRAVVQEGHRFAHGVMGRLQRISPDAPLHYHDDKHNVGKDWVIPAGTPVSMTAPLQHRDPTKFPDPHVFDPARWLVGPAAATAEEVAALERYLVPFGKGTRHCLGLNLATAEIYQTLAAVFGNKKFEMGLYETSARDAEAVRDYFIPHGHADSRGVRVVFN